MISLTKIFFFTVSTSLSNTLYCKEISFSVLYWDALNAFKVKSQCNVKQFQAKCIPVQLGTRPGNICNNGTIEMKLLQLQWNSYDCNRALHEANMRFIDRDYYTPGRIGIGGNSTGRLVLAFKLVLFCCKSEKIPLSMWLADLSYNQLKRWQQWNNNPGKNSQIGGIQGTQ